MPNPDPRDIKLWMALILATAGNLGYTGLSTGDRFTGADGAVLSERVRQLEARVDQLPPEWLRNDMYEMREELKDLRRAIKPEL